MYSRFCDRSIINIHISGYLQIENCFKPLKSSAMLFITRCPQMTETIKPYRYRHIIIYCGQPILSVLVSLPTGN